MGFRRAEIVGFQDAGRGDDDLGAVEQGKGRRCEAGDAVVAGADDGEPAFHCAPAAIALSAAPAMALPPRRPSSVTKGMPRGLPASSALDSAAPTKPTGKGEDGGRARPAGVEAFEKREQGGRRVADNHDRAVQPFCPQGDGRRRTCRPHFSSQRLGAWIVEGADHLGGGRKRAPDDRRAGHLAIDEDRLSRGERGAHRLRQRFRRRAGRRRCRSCRRHGSAGARPACIACGRTTGRPPRGSSRRTAHRSPAGPSDS
jgi:hypothetical protein